MQRIVIASKNQGKIKEFSALLSSLGFSFVSLLDFPEIGEIPEKGTTFEENARQKAVTVSNFTGLPALADDSGLVVDALGGRPGVFSARYAGEPKDDLKNIQKLLKELEGVPWEKRTARFVAVLCLYFPDGSLVTARGECEGYILEEMRGSGGFGYDPVFYLPDYGKTMAELPLEVKNKISHRARALEELLRKLKEDYRWSTW
ncbi:XTP/dITP diphosphatase [Carboxydothermus ferrireducens]|uniref:dITP/XTP pyrophosphatase n=1 Tax=Carboxydothermus ferrireducens DSM 11255 TaxID=1119529 RepID=A0ABX2R7Y5_9THEO|nr:XTP/dITP diphosphatase [Carboxydothermus ferrireducens]NYE57284.1 XTP/dITP diphosphohydrolase [Carboxydothermus ferrireducens DSM 11255]